MISNKSLRKKRMSSCFLYGLQNSIFQESSYHSNLGYLPHQSKEASGFFPIFCSPSIKPANTSGGCLLLVGIRVSFLRDMNQDETNPKFLLVF